MNAMIWISCLCACWVWILMYVIRKPAIDIRELEKKSYDDSEQWNVPKTNQSRWEKLIQFTKENQSIVKQFADILNISEEKTNVLIYQANVDKKAIDIINTRLISLCFGVLVSVLSFMILSEPMIGIIVLVLSLYAYMYPEMNLRTKAKSRQKQVQKMLPEVMDVFSILLESGTAPLDALIQVSNNFEGPIAEEFARVYQRAQYNGFNWVLALQDSAELMQVEELQDMVNAIAISVQKGTPLSYMIRDQVDRIRFFYQQKAEERAAKSGSKIMFVTMIFVLIPMIAMLVTPSFFSQNL